MKGLTVRVLKMHPLWGEALPQVQLGWLIDPIRFDNSGMAQGFSLWGGGANFAFRVGVEQNEKLRAFGGLRRYMVNLRTSFFAPNYSPNLGPHFPDG